MKKKPDSQNNVCEWQVCDILNTSESSALCTGKKFDVCLDKGTYDAISLNPEDAKACRVKYIDNVFSLLAAGGLFIICSCNWTKTELLEQFKDSKYKQIFCALFWFRDIRPKPNFKQLSSQVIFGCLTTHLVILFVFAFQQSLNF